MCTLSGTVSTHAPHPDWFPLKFISVEAASGMALLLAALVALVWANSAWAASYFALWHLPMSFGLGAYLPEHDLHFWVNDGLMTLFFLVVGLEIRREMHDGALADPKVALLPIIAAAGGVIVPALFYVLLNTEPVDPPRLGHPDRHRHRLCRRCAVTHRPRRAIGAADAAAHARHHR